MNNNIRNCGNCNALIDVSTSDFCPNCGAKIIKNLNSVDDKGIVWGIVFFILSILNVLSIPTIIIASLVVLIIGSSKNTINYDFLMTVGCGYIFASITALFAFGANLKYRDLKKSFKTILIGFLVGVVVGIVLKFIF